MLIPRTSRNAHIGENDIIQPIAWKNKEKLGKKRSSFYRNYGELAKFVWFFENIINLAPSGKNVALDDSRVGLIERQDEDYLK